MSDSIGKSLVVGRIGAGVSALIAVVAGILGYSVTPEMVGEAETIINNGYQLVSTASGLLAAVLAWYSKFKESKK
jgi:hypothetical protein